MIFLLFIHLIILSLAFHPDFSTVLKGEIVNEEGQPIAYAHIGFEGDKIGTVSNMSGEFSLEISGISKTNVLIVSTIGYETQRFLYDHLPKSGNLKIVLIKRVYSSEEIEVTAPASQKKTFGSISRRNNAGWSFAGIAAGNQVGIIIKNSNSVILSKIKFQVKTNGYDSLLYRVNFSEIDNGAFIPIQEQDIYIRSKVETGIISLDLTEYNIQTSKKFAVTIEVLKGWENKIATEQKRIIFVGRNSLRKQTIIQSHPFAPLEYDNTKLNLLIEYFLL